MIEKKVKIVNRAGLHVRPAANLVKLSAKYKSDFFIFREGMEINGKSIIGVMTLVAAQGTELVLKFDGVDEKNAMEEIVDFFERGFDEL